MLFIALFFITFILMTQSQVLKNQRTRGVQTKSICKTNGKENHIIASISWQLLPLSSSCEFNFFTESLHKLFELDNAPFCSASRFRLHCHMICFVGIWDNGPVDPHVASSHMNSISDKHLK